MARQSYQKRLVGLRDDVLTMSDLVCRRLRQGLEAMETNDEELAEWVITSDHEINVIYLELEQECVNLIALQQPVAGDLRFIAASFKIITDLERIADLATNLGRYTLQAEHDVYPEVDVQEIGRATLAMVEEAMAAYATEDADRCFEVDDRDDDVDALCERASQRVVRNLIDTQFSDGANEELETLMQDVSRILLTIRDLERVGDHAVNISARTLYMVENDDELIY